MDRPMHLLAVITALVLSWLWMGAPSAQQTPQYPLDDKLANEPAPWAVPANGASTAIGADGARTTSAGCSTT